mgnify:CR=1 FL=1
MADLKKIAAATFKNNKDAKAVHVTADGQAFVNKNRANLHANSNKSGKALKVVTFQASEFVKDNSDSSKADAPTRIANIQKLETVAEVEAALKDETAKTVLAAGKEKIEALNSTEDK